jgi:uncharacterized protein (DUF2147 family)
VYFGNKTGPAPSVPFHPGFGSAHWAVLALAAVIVTASAHAQPPAGLWRTFNERGQAEALVRIVEQDGELRGQVVTVFSPPAPSANPVCEECSGELKNRPIVGMTILRGLRWDGVQYSGGEILDPDNGTLYRCRIRVAQDGRKLEVRGFIGVALFGRTQVWTRE